MNGFVSDADEGATWLPNGFVGELLPFVLAEWEGFLLPPKVTDEDKITALFRRSLKHRIRKSQQHNWMVLREVPVENQEGSDIGWTDLRILPPDSRDEDFAFVFECKRLNITFPNGKFRHNAAEYVDEGMMRFVTGQYSATLHEAGILGYVMDGNTTGAQKRVVKMILTRRSKLRLVPRSNYSLCRLLGNRAPHGETRHDLTTGEEFILYHLLVPVRRFAA